MIFLNINFSGRNNLLTGELDVGQLYCAVQSQVRVNMITESI